MKKFLVLAISIIMILAFAGCNGADVNDNTNQDGMYDHTDAPTAATTLDDATTLPEMIPSEMPDIDVNITDDGKNNDK